MNDDLHSVSTRTIDGAQSAQLAGDVRNQLKTAGFKQLLNRALGIDSQVSVHTKDGQIATVRNKTAMASGRGEVHVCVRDTAIITEEIHLAFTDRMYAPTELGRTRRITPEGYLVCEGVAIARTGEQRYMKREIPHSKIDADSNGQIRVDRLPEHVFRKETLESFEGKSVTVEHPNDFVTPANWKEHEIGQVQNVRRGEGIEDDLMIADLVIKDPEAISYVNTRMPEVSCGYNSDYKQTGVGRGIQYNIIGNHVALVDRGRAGPRCAIKDHQEE